MRIIALFCGLLLIVSGCTQESREAGDRPITEETRQTGDQPTTATEENQQAVDQPIMPELSPADDRPVKILGDGIKAYYSAYKSTFLEPKIADTYNIVRARDRGVVNISVMSEESPYGISADVDGVAKSLTAMRQELDFMEVQEGDAIYYLAAFDFNDEDALTFEISVKVPGETATKLLEFQRTFRIDDR